MAALDSRLFKSLANLFNQSQESSAGHEKLVSKCQQYYREVIQTTNYCIYVIRDGIRVNFN